MNSEFFPSQLPPKQGIVSYTKVRAYLHLAVEWFIPVLLENSGMREHCQRSSEVRSKINTIWENNFIRISALLVRASFGDIKSCKTNCLDLCDWYQFQLHYCSYLLQTKELLICYIYICSRETNRDKSSRVSGLQIKPHVIIADSALTFLYIVGISF